MKSNTRGFLARAGVLACGFAAALAPTPAHAEESAVGPDILIPKLAEFIPALVAFLIIWAVLAKLVWPQVLQMMEKRQEKIQSDLDSAERSKLEAAEKARSYDELIAQAHSQAEAIVAEARREASKERAAMLARAQVEVSDIIAKAHGAVETERHKAAAELSGSVVDLSVEIAEKIIGGSLGAEEQRKLAERYLMEVSIGDDERAR